VKDRPLKNVAASVFQRLKNLARETDRRLDEWLCYFAMERFLFRLSRTSQADQFVLKGAMLFKVWQVMEARSTMDIDLLGSSQIIDHVEAIIRETCRQEVHPEDGLVFDTRDLQVHPIAEQADFDSVRASFRATLVNARIPLQVDVGFGRVTPAPITADLPSILDFPNPQLLVYTRETVIAEKLHAMVKLGMLNSRMKDFLDIWVLSRHFSFDGQALSTAITDTFAHRKTGIPESPVALTRAFGSDPTKKKQWSAYLRKQRLNDRAPASLEELIHDLHQFLHPVLAALETGQPFHGGWPPKGPWTEGA
jgi:hypothetical protein